MAQKTQPDTLYLSLSALFVILCSNPHLTQGGGSNIRTGGQPGRDHPRPLHPSDWSLQLAGVWSGCPGVRLAHDVAPGDAGLYTSGDDR